MKIGDIVIALPYSDECKKTRGIIREIAFIGFYVSIDNLNELRFLVASEVDPINCSVGRVYSRLQPNCKYTFDYGADKIE